MRNKITSLAIAVLAAAGFAAFAAAPAASATAATCVTSTIHLADRPDSGFFGGDWALDTFTRTTQICQADQLADSASFHYHATVTDSGTFVATKNPATGDTITAHGTMTGGFTEDFTAGPLTDFANTGDGKSFTGDDPSTTGNWVKYVWGHEGFDGAMNDDWTWTYKTYCGDKVSEQWVDANSNGAGDPGKDAGEITGKACPTPTATPTQTQTATATASPSQPSLPVTGSSTSKIALVGSVVLLLGAGLLWVGRRRRAHS